MSSCESPDRPLEVLAVAAHGGGVVLHGLAAVWHRLRDRRFGPYAWLHVGLALFSAVSIVRHWRRLR